ncbi:MAG: MBL fold metallo-hydrolase [Pseudomonadota bacterium]|nr:MBL fold metallo-hydrolase [Pseudomonadota bacterium]
MRLTVLGCGDAFGAGGRLHTCFHIASNSGLFLIDCGATALIGLRKAGLDPNAVGTIFITHLHGDHFGGLAWFLIDACHVSKRTAPITIAGPQGIEARYLAATEALFPKATEVPRNFDMRFVEYREGERMNVNGFAVTAHEVRHFSGAPPYALRIEADGKAIAFTGDTEWVESIVPAARDADLFIAECYQYDIRLKFHLDYETIAANFDRIGAKRVLLTHMSEAMLARRGDVNTDLCLCAEDGMTLEI